MIEYEYSFRVKDLKPYINYCENNGYTLIKEEKETRILYKNDNKILARITTRGDVTKFDLKDDTDANNLVKSARESLPITLSEDEIDAALSMLEMLGFAHHKTLERNRTIYESDDITFEMDEYLSPEQGYVMAIEGAKEKVDKIYNEISNIENNYYRVTYEDVGIYEALELNLPKDVYKDLLKNKDISWLPKTNNYKKYKASYFTNLGFSLFNTKSLPLIEEYLEKDLIKIQTVDKLDNIIYEDKYQILTEKDS